jgi:hypothetical protein
MDAPNRIAQIVSDTLMVGTPDKITLVEFAKELSLPDLTFTYGAVWNWKKGKNIPDTDSMAEIARRGQTPRARTFARRILEVKGLMLVEDCKERV